MKSIDHCSRQLQRAIAHHTLLEVLEVTILKRKQLQIVNGWLTAEAPNFEDSRIVFPGHALPERLKKQLSRRLERRQTGHYNLSPILGGQKFYNRTTLGKRMKIGFGK
jgi:hypothetical protein